jgi:hypothetical protein
MAARLRSEADSLSNMAEDKPVSHISKALNELANKANGMLSSNSYMDSLHKKMIKTAEQGMYKYTFEVPMGMDPCYVSAELKKAGVNHSFQVGSGLFTTSWEVV